VDFISEIFSIGVGVMTYHPMRESDHIPYDARVMTKGQTNKHRAIIRSYI